MGVQLNFINQSNDANNSQIVIFQKNVASDFEELPWRGGSSETADKAITILSHFPSPCRSLPATATATTRRN
jgi:hypothetical protein